MSLTSLLVFALFAWGCLVPFFSPFYGVLVTLAFYFLNPVNHWWGEELATVTGPRWQFWLTLALLCGFFLNLGKYQATAGRMKPVLAPLSVLLAMAFLMVAFAEHPDEALEFAIRLAKVFIFTYLLVRTCQTMAELRMLFTVAILGCAYFGYEAYTSFDLNRIETVGGPDSVGSNELAFVLLQSLPLTALWIVRGDLRMRVIGLLAAPFIVNALILTRSRGAFLGVAVMVTLSVLFAPRRFRYLAVVTVVLGALAFFRLADQEFWERIQTIETYGEDLSANTRLEIWKGAVKLIADHPFGIGGGNFIFVSRHYAPSLSMNRVTHNTWVQVCVEYGPIGLLAFLGLVFIVSRLLWRLIKAGDLDTDFRLTALAVFVAFWGYLVAACFGDRLYADAFYWFVGWACILNALAQDRLTASIREPLAEDLPALNGCRLTEPQMSN